MGPQGCAQNWIAEVTKVRTTACIVFSILCNSEFEMDPFIYCKTYILFIVKLTFTVDKIQPIKADFYQLEYIKWKNPRT